MAIGSNLMAKPIITTATPSRLNIKTTPYHVKNFRGSSLPLNSKQLPLNYTKIILYQNRNFNIKAEIYEYSMNYINKFRYFLFAF